VNISTIFVYQQSFYVMAGLWKMEQIGLHLKK